MKKETFWQPGSGIEFGTLANGEELFSHPPSTCSNTNNLGCKTRIFTNTKTYSNTNKNTSANTNTDKNTNTNEKIFTTIGRLFKFK